MSFNQQRAESLSDADLQYNIHGPSVAVGQGRGGRKRQLRQIGHTEQDGSTYKSPVRIECEHWAISATYIFNTKRKRNVNLLCVLRIYTSGHKKENPVLIIKCNLR